MRISIVIPAYNEAARIESTLVDLAAYRRSSTNEIEVIVVDDGSTDTTAEVLLSSLRHVPDMIIARHRTNRGKGRAVASGMALATGDHHAFFDADGATPFAALDDLLATTAARHDLVAIGSLRAAGSTIARPQSRLRTLAGRVGNALIRAAVLPGIADTQRGCKLFPAAASELTFPTLETDGWAFDIEILAKCRRLGYEVVEVPVEWRHIDGGQVATRAYAETLSDIGRIRSILKDVPAASALTDDAAVAELALASAGRAP